MCVYVNVGVSGVADRKYTKDTDLILLTARAFLCVRACVRVFSCIRKCPRHLLFVRVSVQRKNVPEMKTDTDTDIP